LGIIEERGQDAYDYKYVVTTGPDRPQFGMIVSLISRKDDTGMGESLKQNGKYQGNPEEKTGKKKKSMGGWKNSL